MDTEMIGAGDDQHTMFQQDRMFQQENSQAMDSEMIGAADVQDTLFQQQNKQARHTEMMGAVDVEDTLFQQQNKQAKIRPSPADNQDTLQEILIRVPLPAVVKFKTVCKHWNNLISHADFRRHHTRVFAPIPTSSNSILLHSFDFPMDRPKLLLVIQPDYNFGQTRLSPLDFNYIDSNGIPTDSYFMILDSLNGLFLVCSIKRGGTDTKFFICNHLTKEYMELPPLPPLVDNLRLLRMNLVFDPSKSFHYKILAIIGLKLDFMDRDTDYSDYYQMYVYFSKSSTWKTTQPHYSDNYSRFSEIICWDPPVTSMDDDETIDWDLDAINLHDEDIICFDLDSGILKSLPEPPSQGPCRLYYKICGGHLYLIEVFELVGGDFEYEVWEIKDIEDCYCPWTLKIRFQLKDIAKILYIHKESEQLYIYVNCESPLHSFEHVSDVRLEFINVADFGATNRNYRWDMFAYHPTLFPPCYKKIINQSINSTHKS